MIYRNVTNLVLKRLERSPAAAIIGPRQSGKTTLAKTLGSIYFDLESPEMCASLDAQWPELVKQNRLIILDEAQSWPEIFPRLRSAIDQDRKRAGRFLLLGSVSPSLMKNVSESLAGRLAIIELTPLLLEEVGTDKMDDLWLYGGYPEGGVLDRAFYPFLAKRLYRYDDTARSAELGPACQTRDSPTPFGNAQHCTWTELERFKNRTKSRD